MAATGEASSLKISSSGTLHKTSRNKALWLESVAVSPYLYLILVINIDTSHLSYNYGVQRLSGASKVWGGSYPYPVIFKHIFGPLSFLLRLEKASHLFL